MAKAKAKAKVVTPIKSGKSLPQSSNIPAGMKQMGGGYAATWTPVDVGDSIHGFVTAMPKDVTMNKGTRKENETRVMEITNQEGERFAVWHSATLGPLFDAVEDGMEVFIQYDGLGKKKPGQNPPKLFTVATSE